MNEQRQGIQNLMVIFKDHKVSERNKKWQSTFMTPHDFEFHYLKKLRME